MFNKRVGVFYVMFNKRAGVFYHNIKHDAQRSILYVIKHELRVY